MCLIPSTTYFHTMSAAIPLSLRKALALWLARPRVDSGCTFSCQPKEECAKRKHGTNE
jgi:hypothetical protein